MNKTATKTDNHAKQLQSILLIVLGLLVCYLRYQKDILLYISLLIGAGSMLSNLFLQGVLRIWHKAGLLFGWINSRILLSAVYYIILFPVAIIFRITAKNPLHLQNTDKSLFVTLNHRYTKEDLENTW